MKKVYFLAAAGMLASLNANADAYYGTPTGAGTGSGESWTDAVAINDLNDDAEISEFGEGDILYLSEGTYTAGAQAKLRSGFSLIGGFPSTATGTDLSGYDPWKYKTIIDAKGKNGGSSFITVVGSQNDIQNNVLTTVKGITITGAVGSPDGDTTYGSYIGSAFSCHSAYLLLEDVTFDKNTSYLGAPVVFNHGAKVHAKHCVWSNNQNVYDYDGETAAGRSAKNNCFQTIANCRVSESDACFTNVVFEGCSMYNNTIKDTARAKSTAQYGGAFNLADGAYTYGTNTAFVNCTIDGSGTQILQNGGMLRTGNKATLNFFAFNTFFNFSASSSTDVRGNIISFNGLTPFYFQGNIMVTPNAPTTTEDKTNNAIFVQSWNNESMSGIISGGDNSISGTQFNTYANNNCTFREQMTTDDWLAASQDNVFGGSSTTEKDGRYYILPTDAYKNVNLETALDNYESFALPDCFKWANIDLSVDMYGKKRAATTYRGAYDPNASDASGIEDVYAANGKKLTVKALGNGNFAIDGAEGTAEVYDLSGRVISRQNVENGMVSIADAANGIYIVRVSGASVKVAR
jgi:hypothetical protein